MRVQVTIIVLLALILAGVAAIGAFHMFDEESPRPFRDSSMRNRPGRGDGPPFFKMNDEERRELRNLLEEFREETSDLHERMSSLEEATFERLDHDPVPRAEVDSLLQEISQVRYEITRRATAKLIDAKTVLSEETREMFFRAILMARPGPMGRQGPGGEHHQKGRRQRNGS